MRRRAVLSALPGLFAGGLAGPALADPVNGLLGRWNMTLVTPGRTYAGWLEIRREGERVRVRLISRWGHPRWLEQVQTDANRIWFVSPKTDEGTEGDVAFEGALGGDILTGKASGPADGEWLWWATRAPSLRRLSWPRWGEPLTLFNGRDLEGWKPVDPAKPAWIVRDGALTSVNRGSDLVTEGTFEDFKLHLEFNCSPGANSGVYLRGRYEVQIENDPYPEPPERRLGGVYGFLAPEVEPDRTPGIWRTYNIALVGRRVTVTLDGVPLIRNEPIPGTTGGALDPREGAPGPLMLQGSEDGRVSFRNIVLTPALA